MKQAIQITAYKDELALKRLIRQFLDWEHFRVYVHVDKASPINEKELNNEFPSIVCYKKYRVCWGSICHIFAVLDLMSRALEDASVGYFHLCSGQDVAIKPQSYFVENFSNCNKSYCNVLPEGDLIDREDWYTLYRVPSTMRFRGTTRIDNLLKTLQKMVGFRRRSLGEFNISQLSLGLIWGSFSRELLDCFVKAKVMFPRFLKALNTVAIPEEVYFASIARKSGLQISERGNRRFSVWSKERGCPAVLDERDYWELIQSDCLFARKVDSVKSRKLIAMLGMT